MERDIKIINWFFAKRWLNIKNDVKESPSEGG
jgi:hypothetical protein